MEGDLVFCFVPFGLDLGSCCCCCWDDIFEGEREREREVLLVLLHLRSGCCFF